jgi:hypothetical protein
MNIADPIYLEQLRNLPSSYLLDLLAENEEIDKESFYWVLLERGMTREKIEKEVLRRSRSTWARPYKLWSVARWLTLFNVLIIAYFNIFGLYQLWHGDHAFRGTLLFLAVGCIFFGFIIGFKLTTHLYQGGKEFLYCGFPIPVGKVDLRTGKEDPVDKTFMLLRMALNATVGVNLVLFPLIFIYLMLK